MKNRGTSFFLMGMLKKMSMKWLLRIIDPIRFKNKKVTHVRTVYLDESGNTGANLIDKEQPIFTMGGVNFTKEEAERLLLLIDSKSQKEVHFSKLKRRKSGQDAVLRLLNDAAITKGSVKAYILHKPFMVTSKIVDILIEHMANEMDFDLYENGENIALSNMLHYCMPAFCGEESVTTMQKLFIEMIKTKDEKSIAAFYDSVEEMKASLSSEDFAGDLNMILITRNFIADSLANVDRKNLDPLIPALFAQCVEWGDEYPEGFHVIHDESKTLSLSQDVFDQFMDWTSQEVELGYDRRKFKLPLKGKSLSFATSETYPQLQVADVITSAINYWANGLAKGETDDEFFVELDKLNLRRLVIGNVWPSIDVAPESLGTIHDGGVNPVDGAADFLLGQEGRART